MKQILACETLTPVFLAGADIITPEIRMPSLKGVMHYWWRAAQHANFQTDLKQAEEQLFGSSDQEVGGSRFRLRVSDIDQSNQNHERKAMLPHKDGKAALMRPFFSGCFSVGLYSRSGALCHHVAEIIELSAIVGGFGKRTRRGFGAFYIKPEPGSLQPETPDGDNLTAFLTRIQDLLNRMAAIPTYRRSIDTATQTATLIYDCTEPFDQLNYHYPTILEIIIKQKTQPIDNILKTIGSKSHFFAKPGFNKACGSGDPRQSSPICFSVYRYRTVDYVVTTLLASSITANRANDISIQKKFRDEVLNHV